MNNRRWSTIVVSAMACAMIAAPAFSQTTGGVRGTVKAKKGGAVSGATLVLRNKETGFARNVQTDPAGNYQFSLMPVGDYELTVTAPGLRTMKDSNLRVGLGQNTVQNFDLDAAEAAAVVEVVAQSAALDATQMTTVTSVDDRLVESIPLQGRNFTDLVALTPMAAPDPENGRVSVGGARGIQNNLTIDGASYQSNFFGEQRGSTRIPFAFGADTVKELQIITNAYDAQYGNAAGAVINAVTKTGTNEFSGSALLQIRTDSLVSKIQPVPAPNSAVTNTEAARTKSFSQRQVNFNFGGPIVKDKLHFFVGAETYNYKEDFTPGFAIASGTSGNNQAAFDAFLPIFGKLVVGPGGRTLAQESGFTYTNDRQNTVLFGRLDWTMSENHRLTLRVNAQDWESENGTTSFASTFAATTGQTNQGLEKNSGLSWVMELNSIFGTNWVNEARIQRAVERRPRYANTEASPEFQIDSGFTAGQNNFLPNGLDEKTWQFIDNLTYSKGDWLVKMGVDLQSFDFKNTFFRYQNGQWRFSNYDTANKWSQGLLGTSSSARVQIQQSFSNYGGSIAYSSKLFAGYIQGAYSGLLDRRLVLNLGMRYTREDQPTNPRPNADLGGLDRAADTSAIDPRFGFTFDPKGDGRTVIRGGYGHFSSPNASLTVSNTMNSNGNTTATYLVTSSGASSTLLANFNSGPFSYAQRFASGGTAFSTLKDEAFFKGLGAPTLVGQVWDPNNDMTLAKRFSIGVERQFDNGWKLGVFGVSTRFENLQYFININMWQLNADGTYNANGVYNDGFATKVNRFTTTGASSAGFPTQRPGYAIVRGTRLDLSKFGNVALSQNGGEGRYQALVLTAQKFSDRGYGVQSSFTLSKARDNNSNERSTFGADSGIPTSADPMAAYGFSDNDRRVRVTVAGYFPVIWGIKGSANYSYTSGRPYTARYTGDVNGDTLTNDIAVGYQRNSLRQPGVKTLDARFSRDFKFTSRFRLETFIDIFNVMNWANFRTDLTARGTSPTGTQFSDMGNLNVPDRNTRELQFGARFRF
jgi:hypothetical protein